MNREHRRSAGPVRHLRRDPSWAPLLVIWEVTQACALACVHCRAEAICARDPAELTTGEGRDLIDAIAGFGKPPPILVLTGGDPFERPDLLELIEHASGRRIPVAVSPSATPNVTPARLTQIREAGASVISLSLDGSTAEAHDGFRGVAGVFDRTLRAWSDALDAGLKVQINTTVTRHNLDELVEVLTLVRERGAMTWSVFFLVPTGRGASLEALTPEAVEDVLHFLYDASSMVSLKTTEAPSFRRVAVQRRILEAEGVDHVEALGLGRRYTDLRARLDGLRAERGEPVTGQMRRPPLDVRAGSGFVFVSHRGLVHPSGFLPLAAGDVRSASLVDIYRSSPLMIGLRDPDRLMGRCGACEFRTVCGGSRARAHAVGAGAFGSEPWCSYVPGSFGRADEINRLVDASSR